MPALARLGWDPRSCSKTVSGLTAEAPPNPAERKNQTQIDIKNAFLGHLEHRVELLDGVRPWAQLPTLGNKSLSQAK